MPNDGDSLKAEMSARLRADWEEARERRTHADTDAAAPPPEPPAEPEPEPGRRLLGRLFR